MSNSQNNTHLKGWQLFTTIALACLYADSFASTKQDDIVGLWKNIDDKTGKAKSIIEITANEGIYSGKIIRLLNPSTPEPVCIKCSGDNTNKPILGLTIINDTLKKENSWGGGTILDPKKGKTYKVKFTLIEQGEKLKVRGFIGVPSLGRTQTWIRQ